MYRIQALAGFDQPPGVLIVPWGLFLRGGTWSLFARKAWVSMGSEGGLQAGMGLVGGAGQQGDGQELKRHLTVR